MACFVAPLSLGVVTTVFRKKVPEALKIGWLNIMLWGGVLMLIVEHIAHQEVVLYPPFFTAGIAEILPEIVRVGIPMSLGIVGVWAVLVAVNATITKSKQTVKQ